MPKISNSSPKILIIEDEKFISKAYQLGFAHEGFKTVAAYNGQEGMEMAKKEKPDLVWLDILLPDMNGLEFLKVIRDDLNLKNLPVVIVSVSSSPEKIKKAFDLNIADFIVKSEGDLNSIVKRVEGHLDKI